MYSADRPKVKRWQSEAARMGLSCSGLAGPMRRASHASPSQISPLTRHPPSTDHPRRPDRRWCDGCRVPTPQPGNRRFPAPQRVAFRHPRPAICVPLLEPSGSDAIAGVPRSRRRSLLDLEPLARLPGAVPFLHVNRMAPSTSRAATTRFVSGSHAAPGTGARAQRASRLVVSRTRRSGRSRGVWQACTSMVTCERPAQPASRALYASGGCGSSDTIAGDHAEVARAQAPQVQVGTTRSPPCSRRRRSWRGEPLVGHRVEQDGARCAQQADRPVGDDGRAHEPHDGVHPHPAEEAARQQRRDGQHRGQRVGQDVRVGGAQVVIVVVMTMAVRMAAVVPSTCAPGWPWRWRSRSSQALARLTASPTAAMAMA